MKHAVTYFDRGYLSQGVALWHSLSLWAPEVELTVLALDRETKEVISALGDPRIKAIRLEELLAADPLLANVKTGRSRSEFIFAITPCLIRHALRTLRETDSVMYLDADLFFFADPKIIWREMGQRSVLIVEHRYPLWHNDAALYGKFNVGVLVFRNDDNGRACVDWWRERCLESTALDAATGTYGDQKYLDEWPRRFVGVAESRNPGVNVAPWNWAGHIFSLEGNRVLVDGVPLLVYHFAQFKWIGGAWFDSGQLEYGIMPMGLRSRLYGEYWAALQAAETEIRGVSPGFTILGRGWRAVLGPWHIALLRLVWGQYWIRIGTRWVSGRFGLGRYSGHAMGAYRRWRRRGT